MTRFLFPLVRMGLGALMAATLFVQAAWIPIASVEAARNARASLALIIPVAIMCEVAMICAHLVIVCVWILLGKVQRNKIFSAASLRWVDLAIGAILVASFLAGVLLVTFRLSGFLEPPLAIMLLGAGTGGVTLCILITLMRRLLIEATGMRDELAEVV